MQEIKQGDHLTVIFDQPLPGNDVAPPIKRGQAYVCKGVYTDSDGHDHIDIGLPMNVSYVRSYATDERLPPTTHWCHPNRFVISRLKL
jgi:hypothetical protein